MAKYGRGLNREIVAAVNRGDMVEPFTTADVQELVKRQKWHSTDNYVNVTLANAVSGSHSPSYQKYFILVDRGKYKLRDQYHGKEWK